MNNWIQKAERIGATHVVVMYDPDDKEEYPVYLMPNQILQKELAKLGLSEGKQRIVDIFRVEKDEKC